MTVEVIKILVVDDSLLYRKIVRDALAGLPGVEIVGVANNGNVAIEKIEQLKPDVITLDFEMPELDGLGVLRWLKKHREYTAKAIMISAFTSEGADATIQALSEGAFDFVVKPNGKSIQENQNQLAHRLGEELEAIRQTKKRISDRISARAAAATQAVSTTEPVKVNPAVRVKRPSAPVAAVAIGVSTGGPDALRTMMPMLPADLAVPVFIVQHMPPVFTKSLADSLNKTCKLNVTEAVDGQVAKPGDALLAPGGKHMKLLQTTAGDIYVRLTDDPPVQSCRPSVDYMFDSLTEILGQRVLGVIMTGMGYDGADACRRLHDKGGTIIAQDKASCVVFGMPRKPVEEGYADLVVPLDKIAEEITKAAGRRGA